MSMAERLKPSGTQLRTQLGSLASTLARWAIYAGSKGISWI